MPRFTFEKFPGSKAELTTMMKSVGETMAIGRTWIESFQKACRGLETGLEGWSLPPGYKPLPKDQLIYKLRVPSPERFVVLKQVCLALARWTVPKRPNDAAPASAQVAHRCRAYLVVEGRSRRGVC